MKKENWIWMPHPGHYCCASQCLFKLNTYVGGYIVSTVGEYIASDNKSDEFDDVGLNRKYETMVFKAEKSDNECCPYGMESVDNVDFEGYNSSEDAMAGHYRFCKKWAKKRR